MSERSVETPARQRRSDTLIDNAWIVAAVWFLAEFLAELFAIPSGPVLILRLAMFFAAIAILLVSAKRKPGGTPIALAVLSATLYLLVWVVRGPSEVGWSVVGVCAVLLPALVLSSTASPTRLRRQLLVTLSLLMWLSLLLGGYGAVTDNIGLYLRNAREVLGLPQLSGLLSHPNTFAAVVGFTLAFQLRFVLARVQPRIWPNPIPVRSSKPWPIWLVILLGPVPSLACLIWAYSRTGFATGAVASILVLLPIALANRRWLRIAVGTGIFLLPFVSLALDALGASGFRGRHLAWAATADTFEQYPWLGAGASFLDSQYWATQPDLGFEPVHAHHLLLQPLGVAGLLGGLLALGLWGLLVVRSTAALPKDGALAIAAVASLGASGSLEASFGVPWVTATYLLATIALVSTASAHGRSPASQNPAVPESAALSQGTRLRPATQSRPTGRPVRRAGRLAALAAPALVAGLILSGCTSGDDGDAPADAIEQPAASTEATPGEDNNIRSPASTVTNDPQARTPDAPFTVTANEIGVHSFTTNPEIPSGSLRRNCSPAWAATEPAKGQYDWSQFDTVMQISEDWGFRDIIYVFCQTPEWAGEPLKGEDPSYGDYPKASQPPKNLKDFEDYARAVVERYGDRISVYQAWNEASTTGFWNGTPRQMAEMTEILYKVVKELDPTATVLSASSQTHEPRYLNQWLPAYLRELATLRWPVDAIAVHGYPLPATPLESGPQTRERNLSTALRYINKAGAPDNIGVWDTEVNYRQSLPQEGGEPDGRVTGDEAYAYPVRSYLDGWRLGVRRSYWYFWTEEYNDFPGIQMRVGDQSTQGMENFGEWVIGADYLGHEVQGDAYLMRFEKNGEPFTIAYPQLTSATITLDGEKEVCRVSDGSCQMISGDLELGVIPVRIS